MYILKDQDQGFIGYHLVKVLHRNPVKSNTSCCLKHIVLAKPRNCKGDKGTDSPKLSLYKCIKLTGFVTYMYQSHFDEPEAYIRLL